MPRNKVHTMTLARREMTMVKREVAAGSPASRVRSFVASNETVDSYNTVIKADGWDLERFDRNPVILFGHQGRDLPVGKGAARIEGTELLVDIDFFDAATNPLAEQALRIIDQGVMGVSVGFEPLDYVYNKERETGDDWADMWNPPLDYIRTRLIEISVVTIPANPDALPIGRDLVQRRILERRTTPPPVKRSEAPPACGTCAQEMVCCNVECSNCKGTKKSAQAPAVREPEPTPEQQLATVTTIVERIVRETRAEKQSADLRRRGKTSRS